MYEGIVQDFIDQFGKLPGVGLKSAQRIAFFISQNAGYDPTKLAELLETVREKVRFCHICGMISGSDTCGFCSDAKRNPALFCVVEEAKDVLAIERTREFRGLYHVLGAPSAPSMASAQMI